MVCFAEPSSGNGTIPESSGSNYTLVAGKLKRLGDCLSLNCVECQRKAANGQQVDEFAPSPLQPCWQRSRASVKVPGVKPTIRLVLMVDRMSTSYNPCLRTRWQIFTILIYDY
jgi:hypothetical protein